MKIKPITKKLGFVLAIAGAAALGGVTTALVSAAIPSTADGKIHGCYKNAASLTDPKGNLRVINSDNGDVCTGQETTLNWNPSGGVASQVAYAYFKPSLSSEGSIISGPAAIDAERTKNILSVRYVDPVYEPRSDFSVKGGFCITVAFEPKNIQVTSLNPQGAYENYGGVAVKSATSGWSFDDDQYGPSAVCAGDPAANAFIGIRGRTWSNTWFIRLEK